MTKYTWNYGESSICIISEMEQIQWNYNKSYYIIYKGNFDVLLTVHLSISQELTNLMHKIFVLQ